MCGHYKWGKVGFDVRGNVPSNNISGLYWQVSGSYIGWDRKLWGCSQFTSAPPHKSRVDGWMDGWMPTGVLKIWKERLILKAKNFHGSTRETKEFENASWNADTECTVEYTFRWNGDEMADRVLRRAETTIRKIANNSTIKWKKLTYPPAVGDDK